MGYALEQKYHQGFKKSLDRIKLAIVYWKNVVLVSLAYTNNDVNYNYSIFSISNKIKFVFDNKSVFVFFKFEKVVSCLYILKHFIITCKMV